jgi:hypothetical protein
MVRGKFIAMSPSIKQIKRSQINNLIMLLKFFGKQEYAKPKNNSWRVIIIIRTSWQSGSSGRILNYQA